MKILILCGFVALLAAGCASQAEIANREEMRCLDYGFRPGTDGWANCRMQLESTRRMLLQQALSR